MLNNFFKKLENFQTCTPDEIDTLKSYLSPVRELKKGEDIIRDQEKPHEVNILLEGWGARYKITREGRYQTLGFLMPGDTCDIHITLVNKMDHSICAITPAKITSIPKDRVEELYEKQPRFSRALFWSMLVDESTLREWLVNIGSRPSDQRLAHLLCELLIRARAAGLTEDHSFALPIAQQRLGEAMGITQVHMSRVMSRLRREELISFEDGRLNIHDWKRMKDFGDFEATYLHLDRADPSLAKDL